MLSSAIIAIVIVVIGARIADELRLRAEERVLRKLDLPEAHAYYALLVRRARKTKLLRAVTLVSLLLVVMAVRRRVFHVAEPRGRAPVASVPGEAAQDHTPLTADTARARAAAAARSHLDPAAAASLRLENVSSDGAHPFIFDFVAGAARLRVFLDARGGVEAHRLLDAPVPAR